MRRIVNGLLTANGTVLMARRSETRKSFAGLWSFPGGHIEPGETPEDALVRELNEEIGVIPTVFRHHCDRQVSLQNGYDAIFHMFEVTGWAGTPEICNSEHSELLWFPVERASELRGEALSFYPALLASLR